MTDRNNDLGYQKSMISFRLKITRLKITKKNKKKSTI